MHSRNLKLSLLVCLLAAATIFSGCGTSSEERVPQKESYSNSSSSNNSYNSHETESYSKKEESSKDDFTVGQRNAIKSAKNYISFAPLSRDGLAHQLDFEKYEEPDIEFALDYLELNELVDWNEQAAKQAQNYLNFSGFSRDGLYHQLEFDKFTPEQIEYALEAVGY